MFSSRWQVDMFIVRLGLLLSPIASRSLLVFGIQQNCFDDSREGLHFNYENGPATLAIGCQGQYIVMQCCATGLGAPMTWYQSQDGGHTWKDFLSVRSGNREVAENGQVVRFSSLDIKIDGGSYKCVGIGKHRGERIENIVELDIRNCSSYSDPPKWLNPLKGETDLYVPRGKSINITCSSYPGTNCDDDVFCDSFWYRMFSNNRTERLSDNPSDRVHISYEYSEDHMKIVSVLSIRDVNDNDYGTYACYAGNGNGDADDRILHLRRDYHVPYVLITVTAAAVGGVLLAVILAAFFINKRTRTTIDLQIWLTLRRLEAAGRLNDGAAQDVLLLHSASDESFASYIKSNLQNRQLSVYSAGELEAGMTPVTKLPELARDSRSVLVLLTSDLANDDDMKSIIGDIIAEITPVFILYGINHSDLLHLQMNIQGAMKINKPIAWPGSNLEENRMPLNEDEEQLQDEDDACCERQGRRDIRVFFKTLHLSLLRSMELPG